MSDLGVKVPRGKTINVFKYNPYITLEKVNQSLANGSLAKKLETGAVTRVEGPSNPRPATLDQVKQSNEAVQVTKTKKSFVVVDPGNPELEEDGEGQEGFGFADYGINDLGPVEQKREGKSVVVEAKQDPVEDEESDTEAAPVTAQSPVSKQSLVAMEAQQKGLQHGMGKQAHPSNVPSVSQPFVVFQPPKDDAEDLPPEPPKQEIKPQLKNGVITPQEGVTLAERDLHVMQALTKKAQELGVSIDELPEATVIAVEAEVVGEKIVKDEAKGKFDSQVATKTESGATVMKVKEVGEEETSE